MQTVSAPLQSSDFVLKYMSYDCPKIVREFVHSFRILVFFARNSTVPFASRKKLPRVSWIRPVGSVEHRLVTDRQTESMRSSINCARVGYGDDRFSCIQRWPRPWTSEYYRCWYIQGPMLRLETCGASTCNHTDGVFNALHCTLLTIMFERLLVCAESD